METIFKVGRTKRYERGKRLPFGYVFLNKRNRICLEHICIEKKALEDFFYKVRVRFPIYTYNMKSQKIEIFPANKVFQIEYVQPIVNDHLICYCQNGAILSYNPQYVTKLPLRDVLMVQVMDHDVILRESQEEYSKPLGIISRYSVVLVDEKEFSVSGHWFEQLRFRVYKTGGYIKKSMVRLLGYADDYTKTYWTLHMETFPIAKIDMKMCILCEDQRCDCVLVHNTTGHVVCCNACAKKIQRKCPVCREEITNIVQIFF